MQTESPAESTEVAETVQDGDGDGGENEYELLADMCGDYDGDGITDEVYRIREYVTYTDGKPQSVMVPSEMHGDLEKINADLRELDKEQLGGDIQYEYELGDDELLYDVHQYIAESGVDFAYTLYKSMPWENNKYIIINPEIRPYSGDECHDIVRLADEIKEKFEMNSVSIFNSYIEDVGRFSEAKANRYGDVYALYNDETDAYDVFMEYDGIVLHNEGNIHSSYVINTNTGNRWPLNAALYATPENEGSSVDAWLSDLNGDGEDEFIIKVTDGDGNDIIFVENVKEHRDISPFYNIAQLKDKEAENISYIAAFGYVYGKEIYETVNEFYKEAGLGTRLSIPSQENRTIRFLKDSSYHCEITEDNRLRLVCAAGE